MSDNPNVNERTPTPPVDLAEIGQQLLGEARESSGRSAVTLTPSDGGPLKQTLIALTAGSELTEHPSPGPAAIHVLEGAGTLRWGDESSRLIAGQWAPLPLDKHGLSAEEDLVALLTVVSTS
ncbi:MAG TPA: cupin domain-containing protein [Egicoccus sp.]|nr:cupin domain-containing protein [Egicoccus sp.]HSK24063.1 cupin domain-containing protein [Egicoccus sp.]